jgi:lia operon protein LiaG
MKPIYKILFLSVFAITLFPSCGFSQMNTIVDIEKTFHDIEEIEISGGPLEVTYEGRQADKNVFLNAFLESNREGSHDITYRVDGRTLKVELQRKITGGNIRNQGFISLTGPENVRLTVRGSSGRVYVSGVTHRQADIRVSSGRMEVSGMMVDNLVLTASSGQILGRNLGGNVQCTVSSGRAELERVDGDVTFKGSSGRYTLKDVQGKVSGSMSSGSITVEDSQEVGSLAVSSGRIRGNNVGLGSDTQLKASSGSIEIQTFSNLDDFDFDLSASSGSLTVGRTKTGKRLSLDNGADATVRGVVSSGRIKIVN